MHGSVKTRLAHRQQEQQEYLLRLRTMTNDDLMNEAFESAVPDEYDGCMTDWGEWRELAARTVLYDRLYDAGILTADAVGKLKEERGEL
jgi:hypothetical protein